MLPWIMSHAELSIWPQMALVLFLGVFIGAAVRVFQRARQDEYTRAAMLPLDDERNGHV
jgi:cbb3-type cytochrome oxidase subunit 3